MANFKTKFEYPSTNKTNETSQNHELALHLASRNPGGFHDNSPTFDSRIIVLHLRRMGRTCFPAHIHGLKKFFLRTFPGEGNTLMLGFPCNEGLGTQEVRASQSLSRLGLEAWLPDMLGSHALKVPPNVRGFFYAAQDPTDEERVMIDRLPELILDAIKQLESAQ